MSENGVATVPVPVVRPLTIQVFAPASISSSQSPTFEPPVVVPFSVMVSSVAAGFQPRAAPAGPLFVLMTCPFRTSAPRLDLMT